MQAALTERFPHMHAPRQRSDFSMSCIARLAILLAACGLLAAADDSARMTSSGLQKTFHPRRLLLSACPGPFTRIYNKTLSGSDLATVYAVLTWDACASACSARTGCQAFTWVTPSYKGTGTGGILIYTCFLKGKGATQSKMLNFDSGTVCTSTPAPAQKLPPPPKKSPPPPVKSSPPPPVKSSPPPPTQTPSPQTPACTSSAGFLQLSNVLISGTPLATLYAVATYDACSASCTQQAGCAAFSWATPSYVATGPLFFIYTCVLFADGSSRSAVSSVTSGVTQASCQSPSPLTTPTPAPSSTGCTFSTLSNVLLSGSPLATQYAVTSWTSCTAACTQQAGCVAVSWVTPTFTATAALLPYTCLLFGPGSTQSVAYLVNSGMAPSGCQGTTTPTPTPTPSPSPSPSVVVNPQAGGSNVLDVWVSSGAPKGGSNAPLLRVDAGWLMP